MHALLFFGAPLDEPRGDSWYFDAEERLDAMGDLALVFFGEAPSVRAALVIASVTCAVEPGESVAVPCDDPREAAWAALVADAGVALGLSLRPAAWHVASVEQDD
jgi:hypothetical protein